MKPTQTIVAVAAFSLFSTAVPAEDTLRPLDTRTRCIVLFRECLVLIDKKDVDGIFRHIADGGASGRFKLYPERDSLSPDLKREIQNAEEFFKHNFPHSTSIKAKFDKILFSQLDTAKEAVTVKSAGNKNNREGKLHLIKIKIPELDDRRFSELRFVEIADKVYWVPFGW